MLVKPYSSSITSAYQTTTANPATASTNNSHTNEHVAVHVDENDASLISRSEVAFETFETIAQYITGTAQNIMYIWDVWDEFCRLGNPVSHAELATAIAQDNYWLAERNALEETLASDEQRIAFINDPTVQLIVLKGWIENIDIDPRILDALKECTPNLSIGDQNQILQLPDYSRISPQQKEVLIPFLIDCPTIQLQTLQGWIQSDSITPRIFNSLQQCAANLSFDDQNKTASLLIDWTLPTEKKVMLLRFITNISSGWQQWIARDINAGLAGTDPIMQQKLVEKLIIFTDSIAQKMMNEAIKIGRLGRNVEPIQKLPEVITHKIVSEKFDESQSNFKVEGYPNSWILLP